LFKINILSKIIPRKNYLKIVYGPSIKLMFGVRSWDQISLIFVIEKTMLRKKNIFNTCDFNIKVLFENIER